MGEEVGMRGIGEATAVGSGISVVSGAVSESAGSAKAGEVGMGRAGALFAAMPVQPTKRTHAHASKKDFSISAATPRFRRRSERERVTQEISRCSREGNRSCQSDRDGGPGTRSR